MAALHSGTEKINSICSCVVTVITLFILSIFTLNGFPLRTVAMLAAASCLIGFILWHFIHRKGLDKYLIYLGFFASPAVILILIETINGNFFELGRVSRILNYLFILAFFMLLRIIIPRFCISVTTGNLLLYLWACINCFVEQFRGKPILPADLGAASTALEVAKGYSFHISLQMAATLAAIILWAIILYVLEKNSKKVRVKVLLPVLAVGACAVLIFAFGNERFNILRTNPWDEAETATIYRQQGMVLSFIKYATVMKVNEPEGYSAEALQAWADEYISSYNQEELISGAVQPQTVIMVMNESLADMSVLGRDLPEAHLSFFESLDENTIKGNLYVSVRGGSTCNTEWESLTGNSTVFLPGAVTPFVSYIDHDSFSLASYFESLGYISEGIHLYPARGWNRENVYPYLGFESFYSIEDLTIDETLRGFATDAENYRKVIDLYEQNAGKKQFIYNVTIQNHGGYDEKADVPVTADLSAYGDYPQAEIYFSLIKLSDEAFYELTSYFEAVDEPVMIIMYGDHQPFLGDDVDAWMSEGADNTPGTVLNKYITPFIIWTNYEADFDEYLAIDKISANFLPVLILKAGNFPLPAFYRYIWDVYGEYPIITTEGIIDKNGNYFKSVSKTDDPDGLLKRYEDLEYNNMFDSENLVENLYKIPTGN